jgi:aminopeptidase N
VPGTVDRSSLALSATYGVDLRLVVGTGALEMAVVIDIRNDSGEDIDRLELNTVAARLGGIDILEASVDDRPVVVTVDDQTLLVPLGGRLPSGRTATARLTYRATLQPGLDGSDWLFSRAGGTLALYRWIPWVSRAIPFDRPNHGDPFLTPTSPLVRVRITTDVPMVLASPGLAPVADGLTWSFESSDMRDVAVVLAPDFRLATGDAGGIPIRAYTRPGGIDGRELVSQAGLALTRIADRLGVPYPWPAFTVVETVGGYGMESPGLIWIPRGTTSTNLAYVVHHETAHQWFYGLVGNDQQAEPFADEAVADLTARTVLGLRRGSRCESEPLDRTIESYSRACYFEVVYIQGGNVLDEIRKRIGTDAFWAAIRGYLEANQFGLAGTHQLLEALRAASPVDLLPSLQARFPSLF